MATVSRIPLSGSTHGRPIKVTGTSTGASVTVHTAQSSTTTVDDVTIYAYNSDTQSRTLTIEFGGTTSPDDLIVTPIPAQQGLVLVVPGMPLRNSLVVKAFASSANVVTVSGFVNRVA